MRSLCEVQDCGEPIVGRGLCRKHYMRLRRKGSTDDTRKNQRPQCSRDGCDRPHVALGLCRPHWMEQHDRPRRVARAAVRRAKRPPRSCAQCGATIPPERRYRGETSFCSRDCKDKARIASGQMAVAVRKSYFKTRYGLTVEQVDEMALAGCSICGTTEWTGRHNRPHVDHDHQTGRVRGILCNACNVMLGYAKDDPTILEAAAAYLR